MNTRRNAPQYEASVLEESLVLNKTLTNQIIGYASKKKKIISKNVNNRLPGKPTCPSGPKKS